jgi:hypothetical protein
MFPFWAPVVRPLIEAAAPKRVVEIGALRGDTTALLLEALADDAELHVIDPVPQFDPSEHERRFAGQYVFHRDLSLNVLPNLAPADVALIDGDHNWFTVYNELRLLQSSAVKDGTLPPIFVLHDVQWPYGRRDGYYAPDQIPDAFRQPCAYKGLRRGSDALLDDGGLNTHVCNALHAGGARNGVLTALEDFLREQRDPFVCIVVDLFTGLGLAADQRRLGQQPALAALWHEIASAEGRARVEAECGEVARQAYSSGRLADV